MMQRATFNAQVLAELQLSLCIMHNFSSLFFSFFIFFPPLIDIGMTQRSYFSNTNQHRLKTANVVPDVLTGP